MIPGRGSLAPTPQGRVSLDPPQEGMISVSIACYVAPSKTLSSAGVLERGFHTQVDRFPMKSLLERVFELGASSKYHDILKMIHQMILIMMPMVDRIMFLDKSLHHHQTTLLFIVFHEDVRLSGIHGFDQTFTIIKHILNLIRQISLLLVICW